MSLVIHRAEHITLPLHSAALGSGAWGGGLSVFTQPTDLNEALLDLIDTSQAGERAHLSRQNTQRRESLFAVMINVCMEHEVISNLVLTR